MNKHLRAAKFLAKLLDNQFSLFGIKFGLDPIFDLVPGVGDIVGAIVSFYIVWIAIRMELPSNQIWKMIRHIAIDFIVGILPIVGPIGDLFYKSNLMNLKILEKYSQNIVEGEILE